MKKCSIAIKIVAGLMLASPVFGTTHSSFDPYVMGYFDRFAPTVENRPGYRVDKECGGSYDGSDYPDQEPAKARLGTYQSGNKTHVIIDMRHGRPNTLFTIWMLVGNNPLTGGGPTPLAAGTKLDELTADWLGEGTANPANGFTTDSSGSGFFSAVLDFPLHGGRYPFNKVSASTLEDIKASRNPLATGTPAIITDPRDEGVKAPFFLRIVSHCQDDLAHGLAPGGHRETWFDFR